MALKIQAIKHQSPCENKMAKALTVGAMKAVTSFNVNYMITGSVAVSGAVTFIEPVVQYCRDYLADHCPRNTARD